jgi:hypothetical protein
MNVDEIGKAIAALAAYVTSYALVFAAVGTITMAFIELAKSVFDFRMHFNRWRVVKWLGDDATVADLELLAGGAAGAPSRRRPVLGYATGEIHRADVLYDQPVEKLMGQIQSAANMALDFPWRYERLYRFLAAPPGAKDESDDAGAWLAYAKAIAAGTKPAPTDEAARAATQARARIGNLVARRLDAFQNEQQYLWAEYNQRVAVVSGTILLAGLLLATPGRPPLLAVLALSVFGGLVAPFAKDVVSALSSIGVRAK